MVSPPIYVKGGPTGGLATCRIHQYANTNANPEAIEYHIFSNISTSPEPIIATNCPSSGLHLNQSCNFSARIMGNLSYTCQLVSSGLTARYTGTIEIQDGAFNVLAREVMMPVH